MKMNAYTTTLFQLGVLMALFCILVVSADERPNAFNRRSQGWTPQALFLYGIMPPRKQKDVSLRSIKRTAWGPRPNIMRAWHPARVSREARSFVDIDEDDEDKRTGWTGRPRVFGRGEPFGEKRVPEELFEEYEKYPLLKRMMEELAEKRDPESAELFEDDLFEE